MGAIYKSLSKKLLVDWEIEAKRSIGLFRYSSRRYLEESWYRDFIADLTAISPQFQTWWGDHDIQSPDSKVKKMSHPLVGELTLRATTLLMPEFPDLQLIVYTPIDDSVQQRLVTLANGFSPKGQSSMTEE